MNARIETSKPKNVSRIFWFMSWFGLLLYLLYLATQSPETLPMRFDAEGTPIKTVSSRYYFVFAYGFVIFMNLIFLVCTAPVIFKRVSRRWWNLPYKDYWFAPENIERGSIRIARMMAWAGLTTNVVMAFVYGTVAAYAAGDLEGPGVNDRVMWIVGLSLLMIPAVWVYLKPSPDKT